MVLDADLLEQLIYDVLDEVGGGGERVPAGSTKEVPLLDVQGVTTPSTRLGTGRRIGTAYFRAGHGDTYADTITAIELKKHLPADAIIAAIKWADEAERFDFGLHKVASTIARGLPDDLAGDLVDQLRDRSSRDLSAEVTTAAIVYQVVVDGLGRDDPIRWIAALLRCDERTAQRRVAKARELGALPPAGTGRIRTTREGDK